MPKKPDSVREDKTHKVHSPMKERSRKPGLGEASYDGEDRRKKDREMKPSGSDKNIFDGIGKFSSDRKSKGGCFPKLLMLLLSIAAGVAYFFLGS